MNATEFERRLRQRAVRDRMALATLMAWLQQALGTATPDSA